MMNRANCKNGVSFVCYNNMVDILSKDIILTNKAKKERARLTQLYGHLYKRHFLDEGYKCFYCGETAQCLDHVPAISTLEDMPKEYMRRNKLPHALVPSCFECNKILTNRNMPHVLDRLIYLESYYEKLMKKQQTMWDDDEIEELGRNMKLYVKHQQEKLHVYVYKIRAIQMRQIKPETYPVFSDEIC